MGVVALLIVVVTNYSRVVFFLEFFEKFNPLPRVLLKAEFSFGLFYFFYS